MAETFGLHTYRFTKGKWMILLTAAAMIALGLILAQGASDKLDSAAPASGAEMTGAGELLGSSFAQSQGNPRNPSGEPTPPGGASLSDFSPFLLKGGFGMFIGFAIGFAMRAFLRLAVVVMGFYLLSLTLLASLGWVEIHWNVMEDHFTRSLTTLGQQFSSFQAFLTGAIPASGMTALGLAVGLRKR